MCCGRLAVLRRSGRLAPRSRHQPVAVLVHIRRLAGGLFNVWQGLRVPTGTSQPLFSKSRFYPLTLWCQWIHLLNSETQPMKRNSLPNTLRTAIRRSGKPIYQLAAESGVPHPSIFRFMSGQRDIRLETAEKLAATLGLRLR